MSPRTEEQYEEIRESKKTLIMETALELFASSGYYNTSISSIAEKAGISKGLMYNYFESKEDLIRQIILKGINEMFQFFDPDKDGILTKEEIRFFIDETFRVIQHDTYFWKLYFMILLQPPVLQLMEKELTKPIESFMDLVKRHFASTGADDPDAEARILAAIFDGIGFQFIINPDNFPIENIKNKLYKMYC